MEPKERLETLAKTMVAHAKKRAGGEGEGGRGVRRDAGDADVLLRTGRRRPGRSRGSYAETLRFERPHRGTAGLDESIIAEPLARQMAEKMKDLIGA